MTRRNRVLDYARHIAKTKDQKKINVLIHRGLKLEELEKAFRI
jgi:hypothetical protein